MGKNFADKTFFPNFLRGFNFADGYDSKFSRDYLKGRNYCGRNSCV